MTDAQNETIAALFRAIQEYDADAAQALFTADATITQPDRPVYHGPEGAVAMINDLARTHTDFVPAPRRTIAQDATAAVEWAATVTDFGGGQSRVEGCSVIDFAGDKVVRMRSYWRPEDLHS